MKFWIIFFWNLFLGIIPRWPQFYYSFGLAFFALLNRRKILQILWLIAGIFLIWRKYIKIRFLIYKIVVSYYLGIQRTACTLLFSCNPLFVNLISRNQPLFNCCCTKFLSVTTLNSLNNNLALVIRNSFADSIFFFFF